MSLAAAPSAGYAKAGTPSGAPATFSARAVALMIAFGLVGFLGLGVLGAYAPMLRGGLQGGGDALSRSAVGFGGIVRILRESGRTVVISRDASAASASTTGLLVLTPPANVKAADIRKLVARSRRPVLLVLPKWAAVPDPGHLGWVLRAGAAPPLMVVRPLREALPAMKGGVQVKRRSGATAGLIRVGAPAGSGALKTGPIVQLQTAAPAEARVLVETPQADPVLTRALFGPYVLSEPDLLDNQAMATPDGARAAVGILDSLRSETGPILFDVTLNGYGRPRSLLLLALTPPFLGASLTALATALLMGGRAAVRFGPARPQGRSLALGKAALLDNSAQLIALARREPRMGRRYAALVRRRLARRALSLDGMTEAPPDRLDPAIDRVSPDARPPFAVLAGAAETAGDVPSLMRAVRALHQRQMEILGEPR